MADFHGPEQTEALYKRLEKDGQTSEDDARRARDEIQKVTDKHTALVDDVSKNKESELLEI